MKFFKSDKTKYNLFIFLSTFAKTMCEVFVPIVLFNKGLDLACIFSYYIIKYTILLLTFYPMIRLGKIVKFKWLLVISSIALGISFYSLSVLTISLTHLFLTALAFGIYTQTYWLGRHYYAMEVLPKKDMADEVGNIIILSQLALIPSAYLGALAIEHLGLETLTTIVTFISIIGAFPIFSIAEKINNVPIDTGKIYKTIPKQSLFIIAFDQLRLALMLLFPLWIYLNVVDTYHYIGILNIAIGIASIFFIYLFARKMDQDKKDYLNLAIILLSTIFLIKLEITNATSMIIIVLFEGLASRMHITSFTRNLYSLGKNYDKASYLCVYEIITNSTLILIFDLALVFFRDLTTFLYIGTLVFLLSSFIKFDDGKGGY
ncbi:MAG: hypothetical protein ACOXZS_03875 [Bacilli bacterium]